VPPSPQREKEERVYTLSFWLALGASFLFFFSFQLLTATFPRYIAYIGGTTAQIGVAMGLLALASVTARPVVGRLVDSWGRRPLLFVGLGIFALSSALYGLARSILPLMGLRLFHGLGIAAFTTAYMALVADLAPPARRGEVIGLASLSTPMSLLVAPVLGEFIMREWGFGAMFATATGAALLGLVTMLGVPEPHRMVLSGQPSNPGMWAALRQRAVWLPTLTRGLIGVTYSTIITFLPLLGDQRGIGQVGFFFTGFAVSLLLIPALAGWLSDRVGRRLVIAPALAAIGLSLGALALARSVFYLLLVALLYGLGLGASRTTIDALLVDGVPEEMRGAALSLAFACFDGGIALGSFILGIPAEIWGYGAMYALVGGVCLLWTGLFLILIRPLPRYPS